MEEVPGYNRYNELNTNSRVNFRPRSQQDIAIDVAQDNSFFEALATKLGVTVQSLRKLSHDYVTHLDDQANSLVTRALISDEVFGHFLELETAAFIKHATLMRGVKNPETNVPTYFTKNAPEVADEDIRTFSPLQLLEKLLSLPEDSPARRELGAHIYTLFVEHPLCRTARFKALCNAYEYEKNAVEKGKIQEEMRAYCSSKDALEHYLLGKSREDRENPNKPNRLSAFYYSKAYGDFFKENYELMRNLTKQQILELLRSIENNDVRLLREKLAAEIKHILSTNPNLAEGRNPQEIEDYSKSENALIWLLRDTTYREQLHFTRACETYKKHTDSRVTKDKIISGLLLDENDERKQEVLRKDSASEEPSLSAGTFRQFKAKHADTTTIRVWESERNNKELKLISSDKGSTGRQEIDVLKTEDAPARYLILTSVPFEPLGSYNDFCLQHTAAARSKINWIKTTLGEARYQTYLRTIGTTHAGLPEIDGIIICDKLSQPEAPLSLSVTTVDKHGKAKKNRSPMLISPNSHYSRKDTIHLLVRKGEYSLGETADETFLRLVNPDLRTPAAPRIEGHIELRGEPIGDPFAYLNKLDKKIARGDENARAARTNLFALMIDLDSPVYTIYRTDNNRFFAKIERGNGFNENDIHDRDKACYRRIKYTIHALFILQLFLAMAPQGAQALVEAREDFNLFWSTMIACDAIFGKMFFLYRISRGNYDNMALALYDLKINGKERFKQFANTMTHGAWGAQHIQRGIGYVAMTFPPGLLFAGLAPMAFDGYTGLVIKDGLTSGYLWLSDNIAQSEAVRIACSLSSFSTNFFSVPIVLYYGQNTIYGIFWDGKIAFLKENDKAFHRSRYIASTTAGLGLTGYLADGFFNFYGLSQAIFGPYLGCAIVNNTVGNITGTMVANATNATAAFPQYAAPAANVIAGYNLGYMELILLMSAYGFGSNAIKLIFDLFSGDAKLSNLPNHDKDVLPENRFRLIPQILIHGLSTVISSSIVLFGSYPNLWQARKTGLTSLNNRITAAGSSAITEVDGTFHGILAFLEGFLRCCYRGQRKKEKEAEAPRAVLVNDDNQDDSDNTKSSYKNRCCPSFWNKISKWRNRNTDTEETALLERNSSASVRSRSSSLDIN